MAGQIPISETQLLFGYFHSYMTINRGSRFILPSIRQEGGRVRFAYPGADIVIDNNWLVQFKRPDYLKTSGIKEFKAYDHPTDITHPYYRIHIKNDNPTNQFNTLIAATNIGLQATYISPIFNDEATFFGLLNNHALHIASYAHIDIAQFNGMQAIIGNNNDHTILYNEDSITNGFCYCFSDPKRINAIKEPRILKEFSYPEFIPLVELFSKRLFNIDATFRNHDNDLAVLRDIQRELLVKHNIYWVISYKKKING